MNSLGLKLISDNIDELEGKLRNIDAFHFLADDNSFFWKLGNKNIPFYFEITSSSNSSFFVCIEPLNKTGSEFVYLEYDKLFKHLLDKDLNISVLCWLWEYDTEDLSLEKIFSYIEDNNSSECDYICNYLVVGDG